MDIENNIHLANDVLDDTQQIAITDGANCIEVNYKEDNFKSNLEIHADIWTTKDISTLLKIYEDKLVMLKYPNKKTMIWIVISKCLKHYNLEVTPDQVRRKINALTNRYKRCLNCGQHERFRYFKEMHKIYAKFNVDADDDNTEVAQKKQSYNTKLISKFNHKTSSKKCQENKAIIQLRKKRQAKKIESDRSQSKIRSEKQLLEYEKRQEEQKLSKDEIYEKRLKVREEEVELRNETFKISESFDYRKMQMWERKHETLLRIEREKFEMLKKMSSLQK